MWYKAVGIIRPAAFIVVNNLLRSDGLKIKTLYSRFINYTKMIQYREEDSAK